MELRIDCIGQKWEGHVKTLLYLIYCTFYNKILSYKNKNKEKSFSLVAEALTGLIYHRPSGENSKFHSLFDHLAKLFTCSVQLGYIPTAWKIATLRMLLKPDKLPSLTTSYRPISLISSSMKLFERVIEQRPRSHLENIGFLNKHQSGFRRANSTYDHLFRLSQSIMESFNRGEHVVAAFLDVEKAFDNVWHNGLRYKIFQLDLPTKMTRWLSDVLVGHAIQADVNGFLSNQINPKAGVPQGSVMSPLLFLIYVNDLHHRTTNKILSPSSLTILHNGLQA